MRKIIKRVLCLLVLVATLCHDAGYSVWAAETNYEQKQYEKDGKDNASKKEHVKDKYTEKELPMAETIIHMCMYTQHHITVMHINLHLLKGRQ